MSETPRAVPTSTYLGRAPIHVLVHGNCRRGSRHGGPARAPSGKGRVGDPTLRLEGVGRGSTIPLQLQLCLQLHSTKFQ